jgi:cell division protein FtsN
MKNKILGFTVCFVLFLGYSGCNSAIYEIVEVEEPIEIKEEVKSPVSEIKEDPKPIENKFSEKQVVSRSYVIQIGAFNDAVNAEKFSNTARTKLTDQDITLKNIDGLYKIRLGSFNNKDEAIRYLDVAKNMGFSDSFVVELTYVKQENK